MQTTINQTTIATRVRRRDLKKGAEVAIAFMRRLLAAIAEGGEVGQWRSGSSAGAQFSMLPGSEQNRLLNRGHRS